ncbi:adenosylcobinamide-GDP ribazoletransferase [Streptomyces sp. CB02923]|uniref:adenosylcobinamide-GDP ribazoletransferase n=1 Tax=Streptomyces sp. CB02923 TaxID=1718985 RepID=UPI00093B8FB2|nr:adenosylcobinamide-GDP ribazoletransferase [Streptomyces sp. CB02923]OKI05134.1 adenosylcobinamide-GDP ribazoletransferase [Streptomyces sp. CB02923]
MNDAATPSGPSPSPTLGDAMRFAFGTLTVLPVRLRRWDRPAARGGMLCAPVAGLVIGLAAAALGTLFLLLGSGPLLAAVATAAVPAVLTRGLHLDGLADTADGLGSGKPAEDALRIMKQSDIGPFGVITLLFTLLAQVAALAHLYEQGWAHGAAAAVVAATAARCALTLAARPGVPPARPDGLGAAVAGTVPLRAAAAAAVVVIALSAALGTHAGPYGALHTGLAALLALAAGEATLRRCRHRFGGITGDIFGAVAEVAGLVAVAVAAMG